MTHVQAQAVEPEPALSAATLVIVPTYEEAGNIEALLTQARTALPAADILVVDDASPDGTASVSEAVGAGLGGVTVLRRPAKAGLGEAYRHAFSWALARPYDVIVTMDADLSHEPKALPTLVAAVAAGADLAIGSRYVAGGSTPGWGAHRRLLSRAGNAYANLLLGLDVNDATSGYRAYRAERLRMIGIAGLRACGYGTQVELAYRVARSGGRLVELPICFHDRSWGESKMSPAIVREALWLVTQLGLDGRLTTLGLSPQIGPRPIPESKIG
ncbi:MAG TPA: polyprenol monophosphomannose synthase [Acidimicrobiales bacterium]|nr:polyprenol monophosphomannose synthase [Acidimicrobiales bacterium]